MPYDPTEAQEIVDQLQKRAAAAPITYTWYGVAIGGLGAALWFISMRWIVFSVSGAVLGGIIGFRLGQSHALTLRTRAQSLLCQMKVEENTRK
jgi:hypothetical protein